MPRIIVAVLLLFFLCEAIPGTKKEFWEEKDYKQWSAQECSNILNNSPWTRYFSESWSSQDEDRIEDSRAYQKSPGVSSDDFGNPVKLSVVRTVNFIVQFQSALPVRQALVRQDQILAMYDSLIPEKRMAFDQKAETLLSPSIYSDKIVITLKTRASNRTDRVYTNTKSVFLCGSNGKKVRLINFTEDPGTRAFHYIFPRQVEGRPLIDAQDKELILECPVASPFSKTLYFKFNLKKMMINGAPQY